MSQAARKLTPGEVVIGFVRPDGSLIGELVDAAIGHDAHSYSVSGLRAQLASGQAIAVTIGKSAAGTITVFGSGAFPPPGGVPLTAAVKKMVSGLVEKSWLMSPVQQSPAEAMNRLVERLRTTGYDGRERAILDASPAVGRRITALRQLEALAATLAAAWLDAQMSRAQLWETVRLDLLPKMAALADIVSETLDGDADRELWLGLPRLLQRLYGCDTDLDDHVGSLLVAAMAWRQLAESNLTTTNRTQAFMSSSTNVAPEFFQRCMDKLGYRPLGADNGSLPATIAKHLGARMFGPDMQTAPSVAN